MFFHFDTTSIFLITSRTPLRNSTLDGRPVAQNTIYKLDLLFRPPASRWTPIYQAGENVVQIQSCITMYDNGMLQTVKYSKVILCSVTNTSGFLSLFQVDLALDQFEASPYWSDGWNVSLSRSRFVTELVPVPRKVVGPAFPDVIVGAPLPDDDPYATILLIPSGSRNAAPLPGARGLGSFKSMAFTADGSSLFAVDEQPSIWRWKNLAASPVHVAKYVHPMADSIWKVMIWTNSRLVLATDYSLNLWTQCSPCPNGTVTAPTNSTDGIGQRCLCPSGTYNKLQDYRSTCTPCTKAGQMCEGDGQVSFLLLPVLLNCM